jgi:hypothetical protein
VYDTEISDFSNIPMAMHRMNNNREDQKLSRYQFKIVGILRQTEYEDATTEEGGSGHKFWWWRRLCGSPLNVVEAGLQRGPIHG